MNDIIQLAKDNYINAIKVLLKRSHDGGQFYLDYASRMHKIYCEKTVPTAGVWVTESGIHLAINPTFFNSLENDDKRAELIVHEVGHVIGKHLVRYKDYNINNDNLESMQDANIAADAAINHLCTNLVENLGVTVKRLNEQMSMYDKNHEPLLDKMPFEYYYERIKQFKNDHGDKLPKIMNTDLDDHSTWSKSIDNTELLEEIIKKSVNDTIGRVGIGNLPGELQSEIVNLLSSQIDWRKELRQFFCDAIAFNKEKSRKKRNRRYGIMFPGKKKKPELNLTIAIDTSGSVSDHQLSMFFSEIDEIANEDVVINIIEADSVVQNVYTYEKGSKFQVKGRGGTAYQPAIDKAIELNSTAMLYFGDMDASDKPTMPPFKMVWVVVGNNNPPANFGNIIRLKE